MYGEQLPEIAVSETLHDIWREIGCAKSGFNGPAPFDWQEIQAFANLTGCTLRPYEARCLMDMSRAYVGGLNDRNLLSKAPMERHL